MQILIAATIGAAVYFAALLLLKGLSRKEMLFFIDMLFRKA